MHLKDLFSGSRQAAPDTAPYTAGLVKLLRHRFGLQPGEPGADVGSVSGKLSSLFLSHGHPLVVVTRGSARQAQFQSLRTRWPHLRILEGRPDVTNLPSASVDFVISERALYWPQRDAVREEFRRILRPGGVVALITDNRIYAGSAQTEAYEQILRTHCRDFREKRNLFDIRQSVAAFFGNEAAYEDAFVGSQALTLDAFLTQTRALPAFPKPDEPEHPLIQSALRVFFDKWSSSGVLSVPVVCRVACGHLAPGTAAVSNPDASLATPVV